MALLRFTTHAKAANHSKIGAQGVWVMANDLQNRRTSRLVDLSLICLPAVQRAGHALGDRFDVVLDRKGDNLVELSVAQQSGGPEPPAQPSSTACCSTLP